ncbi:uncharacterized protein LOC124541213 [Vanessa cardui]|uniref:uncharacterized protein LOC124541213 n=1 Tax=Vanessa cardui TaxID=171605 RepID=UPI001F13C2F5|nr:uncharacterized protein LOC124541213 [Vanessa cardui]
MISSPNYKSVQINITTYKYNIAKDMTEDRFEGRYCKNKQSRYVCSVCLNHKRSNEDYKIIEDHQKPCPICQKGQDNFDTNYADPNAHKDINNIHQMNVTLRSGKEKHGKNIQTSQTDITQGMSLLNEVLSVFQSKKQSDNNKDKSHKTIIMKDASVSTEENKKDSPKLTLSKIFYCSIEETSETHNNKFMIINCQPETTKTSQFSIDLINRKSSSIPQMKLEELKKSLKEKTKSKDAIEEVNRMFASVRKYEIVQNLDIPNRPMVRNGPRVLPVVKTTADKDTKGESPKNCRNCQTNYKMSSGDSYECVCVCHTNERCENCFYMKCHHQHRSNPGAACPNR